MTSNNFKKFRKRIKSRDNKFIIEICFHVGRGLWLGEWHFSDGNPLTEYTSYAFHFNRLKIPRLIRSQIAEFLNPEIRQVREKLRGDRFALTPELLRTPLNKLKGIHKYADKVMVVPWSLRMVPGRKRELFETLGVTLKVREIVYEERSQEEKLMELGQAYGMSPGRLNGLYPRTVIVDESC
jgi:hypothetical protein